MHYWLNLQDTDIDIEDEIQNVAEVSPYIVVLGDISGCQYFIVCEKEVLVEAKSMKDAIIDLMAAFYVFDIAYPKSTAPVLLFIQRYVLNIKDSQPMPPSCSRLITSLNKLVNSEP